MTEPLKVDVTKLATGTANLAQDVVRDIAQNRAAAALGTLDTIGSFSKAAEDNFGISGLSSLIKSLTEWVQGIFVSWGIAAPATTAAAPATPTAPASTPANVEAANAAAAKAAAEAAAAGNPAANCTDVVGNPAPCATPQVAPAAGANVSK